MVLITPTVWSLVHDYIPAAHKAEGTICILLPLASGRGCLLLRAVGPYPPGALPAPTQPAPQKLGVDSGHWEGELRKRAGSQMTQFPVSFPRRGERGKTEC